MFAGPGIVPSSPPNDNRYSSAAPHDQQPGPARLKTLSCEYEHQHQRSAIECRKPFKISNTLSNWPLACRANIAVQLHATISSVLASTRIEFIFDISVFSRGINVTHIPVHAVLPARSGYECGSKLESTGS